MCHATAATLPIRERQEVMGLLNAEGGPRNWKVAGMYFDLLGPAESFAHTPYRRVQGPYGEVVVMKPEDLLVERVLVSVYPRPQPLARQCARTLIGVSLRGQLAMDWGEVWRVAQRPEYRNLAECQALVNEVAAELKIRSPLHSD